MTLALFLLNFVGLGISVFPVSRAARDHHLGCGGTCAKPDDSCWSGVAVILPVIVAYTLGILGVPRQGPAPTVIIDAGARDTAGALMSRRPVWKRLGWMLLIWSASVAALGVLSLVLGLWLKPRL